MEAWIEESVLSFSEFQTSVQEVLSECHACVLFIFLSGLISVTAQFLDFLVCSLD